MQESARRESDVGEDDVSLPSVESSDGTDLNGDETYLKGCRRCFSNEPCSAKQRWKHTAASIGPVGARSQALVQDQAAAQCGRRSSAVCQRRPSAPE